MYYEGKVAINEFVDLIAEKARLSGWTVTKIPTGVGGNITTTSTVTGLPFTFSSNHSYGYNSLNNVDEQVSYCSVASGSYSHFTIDTGASKGYVINGMALTSSESPAHDGLYPDSYQLFGSDDNSTWTQLTEKTNLNFREFKTREVLYSSNTTEYRYYQIRLYNDRSETRTMYIRNVEFLEDIAKTKYYGYILESSGSSGSDNIILYLNNGVCKVMDTNFFFYGMVKSFNRVTHQMSVLNTGYSRFYIDTYSYSNANVLSYTLNISDDRIILAHCTDKYLPAYSNQVLYLGLMDRYSTESDNGAVCIMATNTNLFSGSVVTLSNKSGFNRGKGIVLWLYPTKSPSMWGDKIFMSPAFIEMENEGVRGSLNGLFLTKIDGMVHGDEVSIGSSKYRYILTSSYGSSALPTRGVLISMD